MSDDVQDREFDGLLEFLKRTRGFDFSAYKRASLMRRARKRLDAVAVTTFSDYTDYLEVHPEEFAPLFNTLLINVTEFFRDEAAWDVIRETVLPQVLGGEGNGRPVRVWSAGCSSGEEAYSAAMLLAEALGMAKFRERVKIYATDADDEALNEARTAVYTPRQVQHVPPALLEKYFDQDSGRFVFNKELRRSVIFARHDLVQDAPISHVGLLICRNTLMYFNAETQARILARFHFALADTGVLFLGKAEMLLARGTQLYRPIDVRRRIFGKVRRRIFGKVVKESWRERLAIMSDANHNHVFAVPTNVGEIYPAVLEASSIPQLVVDGAGNLAFANEKARALLLLHTGDVGRPFRKLDTRAAPLDLPELVDRCMNQRREISVDDVTWPGQGAEEAKLFKVQASPLSGDGDPLAAVLLSFEDVTEFRSLQRRLERSHQELETASEELQSTNEELETTNEELQSTVEELETTNEELQSTNEELETMNEELQSTNEELQTINDELRERSDDLNRANAFLESILSGVPGGVVVVDRNLQVLAWNHRAEDLWGLRDDEVKGRNLLALDIGLPLDDLRQPIRACLGGDGELIEQVVPATNRRGRAIQCKVTCTRLVGGSGEVRGAILLMDEMPAVDSNRAPAS